MSGDPDDEALRWDGDDDPTLAPGWKRVGKPVDVPPEPGNADATDATDAATPGEPDEAHVADEAIHPDAAAQPGSAELVLLGVFAGVYLLYSIGWILTVTGFGAVGGDDPVSAFMFSVGLWLAVVAPTLWYVTAFASTKGRPRTRIVWMLLGVIVLVPLPFVVGVNA